MSFRTCLSVRTCSFTNYSFISFSILLLPLPIDEFGCCGGFEIVFDQQQTNIIDFFPACIDTFLTSSLSVCPNICQSVQTSVCLSEHVRLLSTPSILPLLKYQAYLCNSYVKDKVLRLFFKGLDKKTIFSFCLCHTCLSVRTYQFAIYSLNFAPIPTATISMEFSYQSKGFKTVFKKLGLKKQQKYFCASI